MEITQLKRFYDIILENTPAYKTLQSDLQSQNISHSYFLKCSDKITREIFSKCFAKSIICKNHNENCVICENIEKGVFADVYFLPENNEVLKVDDAEKILNTVNLFGLEQEKKIYILDKFEFATPQMQNKLLKILEEPPQNVYFLLMCEEDTGVIAPIKSRCKKLFINNLNPSTIDYILNSLKVPQDKQEIAKFVGDNFLGRTLEVLENKAIQNIFELCLDIFVNCNNRNDILKYSTKIASYKNEFDVFLRIYSLILSHLYFHKCSNTLNTNAFVNELKNISQKFTLDNLIKLQEKTIKYNEEFIRNCNLNIIADKLIFDNLEARI